MAQEISQNTFDLLANNKRKEIGESFEPRKKNIKILISYLLNILLSQYKVIGKESLEDWTYF